MAKQTLNNAYVTLAGSTVYTFFQQVNLTYEAETVDDTTMGDGTRSAKGSLLNWAFDGTVANDYASGQIDSQLHPLMGTDFLVTIQPTTSAISASNPSYQGRALLTSYNPISGSVGDLATSSLNLVGAKGSTGGVATLSRITT